MNFKNIHIGVMIEKRVKENQIDIVRICNFLKCSEEEVLQNYSSESIDSELLLKWSKLLQYDFFRIYSQHILLFSASPFSSKETAKTNKSALPQFRKNIYTKEIIDFILDSLRTGEKTKKQILDDYGIPKTTLYKWINKYNNE